MTVQDTQPWLSDDDSPRCKDGVTFTGHLHATGLDRPGLLIQITTLLAQEQLDITSIQCNQHYQTSMDAEHEVKGAELAATAPAHRWRRLCASRCSEHLARFSHLAQLQQRFQITGVVRAFCPVDRATLNAKLIALEHDTGIRLGITETESDMSFSAFSNAGAAANRPVGVPSRLIKTMTGALPPRA